MDYSEFKSCTIDKHSTGGLGDKTSLLLSPIVACLGFLNPMVTIFIYEKKQIISG